VGWTIFKDLRAGTGTFSEKPNITPEEIDAFLVLTPLQGLGRELIRVAEENAVNPVYILAHIIHETGWGKSAIFSEKNNLFGFGACDKNPRANAVQFSSPVDCLEKVVKFIAREYLTVGGKYYANPNLVGMNKHYATDKAWCNKVMIIMNKIEEFVKNRREKNKENEGSKKEDAEPFLGINYKG